MTPDGEFREAVARLHRAKNAAYRDAWKRRGEVISILANIARKVDRLEYGLDDAPATVGESWLDTAERADRCRCRARGHAQARARAGVRRVHQLVPGDGRRRRS